MKDKLKHTINSGYSTTKRKAHCYVIQNIFLLHSKKREEKAKQLFEFLLLCLWISLVPCSFFFRVSSFCLRSLIKVFFFVSIATCPPLRTQRLSEFSEAPIRVSGLEFGSLDFREQNESRCGSLWSSLLLSFLSFGLGLGSLLCVLLLFMSLFFFLIVLWAVECVLERTFSLTRNVLRYIIERSKYRIE